MNRYPQERRFRVARRLALTLALPALITVLLCGSAAAVAGPSVLTARTVGGHDALWLVSPTDGAATSVGTLPGLTGSAAVSPDGALVAYLPQNGRPVVWLGYGALSPRTISLRAAGLRHVSGLTWIAPTKLLVSGSKGGRYFDTYNAGLYTVDVETGRVASFRGLRGVEPSADPTSGKVAYVRFTRLDAGSARTNHTPLYRETLKLTSVGGSTSGRTIATAQYRPYAEQRAFSRPQLAAGAQWILTGATGSDVRITYTLYDTGSVPTAWLSVFAPSLQAAAWSPKGRRVAFAGVAASSDGASDACVYIDDVTTGTLTRTPVGILSAASAGMIAGVAWSSDGMVVADALDIRAGAETEHVLVMRGDDLGTVRDIGPGHLSVWVP